MSDLPSQRFLVIGDTPAIHDDLRKILVPLAARGFELDSAFQGKEGLAKVAAALAEGRPYAIAFVAMPMPQGLDGVETVTRLGALDPLLQIVICTADTDHSWDEALSCPDVADRLLILKKPFDPRVVRQIARMLSAANAALLAEMAKRRQLEGRLARSEELASLGRRAASVARQMEFIVANLGLLDSHVDALFSMLAAYEGAAVSPELDATYRRLEIGLIREDTPGLLRETRDGILRVRQVVQDLTDLFRVEGDRVPPVRQETPVQELASEG